MAFDAIAATASQVNLAGLDIACESSRLRGTHWTLPLLPRVKIGPVALDVATGQVVLTVLD